MEKIAIYARKSTESEDRQVLSIDSQIRELRQYAQAKGWTIASVFSESKSAKSPGRPIFTKLMESVQAGKFDAILCWKLDRLARNPVDGGALIWALDEKTLHAILTPQRELANNGNDKFWLQLEFGMAKKYVDDLSDNVKRGNRAKLEQGWLPQCAPLGYRNDKETKTIVKDPERFAIVKRMWQHLLTGQYSVTEIHRRAIEDWGLTNGVRSNGYGRPLARSAVHYLFRNPFYYGALRYNGVLYVGAHQPMISKRDFDKAQRILDIESMPKPHRHSFTYTGLLRCGNCGAAITAEHKKNRYGHRYIYYHCTRHKYPYDCAEKAIEERQLEKQLADWTSSISLPKGFLKWALAASDEMDREDGAAFQSEKPELRRKLSLLGSELDELLNMRLARLIDDDEFAKRKAALKERMAVLQERIDRPEQTISQRRATLEQVFAAAENAHTVFNSGSEDRKKRLLRASCSNLLLRDKKALITAREPYREIQKTVEIATAKNAMFEPQILGQLQPRKRAASPAFSIWWGLVKKVRTFCPG
ncbi:MAG: recombinase family protein [candidate division Zixibacteria bacterium]|jgi:DNA invertase Pin-like site-specific DNA recombinase|nr:recombinase family protein [candidate division Zixibacteria bacterium]